MTNIIEQQFDQLQSEADDLYQFLNMFKDWFNKTFANYEIHLEDHWTHRQTIIEYILKSMDSFNIIVLAQDIYSNRRDEKGVWHLGDYIETVWKLENAKQYIKDFIKANGEPRFR